MVLMTIILLSLSCQISEASPIKFVNTIPDNGSEITSFDIKFKFDISLNIEEQGSDNIGIGYNGFYDESEPDWTQAVLLYEGSPENGKLLAVTLDSNVKGSSQSKDIINLNFPSSIVPEAGKTYTLVCNNSFPLFNLATGKTIKGAALSWENDPQTFTFIGAKPTSSDLLFQTASLQEGSNIPSINSINFEFNEDIAISQAKEVQIWNGENIIASSKSVEIDPENSKALRATFDDVTLYLGNEYSIRLPEGIVSLKNDAAVLNKPVEIKVNGTSTMILSTKSVSPDNNTTVLPDKATIKFNLEEGQTLTPKQGIEHKRGIDFYKDEISEENFICTLLGTASGDGISWDFTTFRFEPETKYILRLPKNGITVWENEHPLPAYGNNEIIITFTTPSIEEAGFAPMELGILRVTDADKEKKDYSEGMAVSILSALQIGLKDNFHQIGSVKYDMTKRPGSEKCKIYEITSFGDKLLTSFDFQIANVDTSTSHYLIGSSNPKAILYEGKKYKLVIPEGYFTIYVPEGSKFSNYIISEEKIYTFNGATPTKSVLLGCNVENDSKRSSLYNIVWTFEGQYRLNEANSTINHSWIHPEGFQSQVTKIPVLVSQSSANTILMVDLVDKITGEPKKLLKGETYIYTIPKGTLVNEMNDEIINDEIVLTVKGGEEETAAKTVNVKLNIDGLHTSTHPATEGKTYQFTLEPAENWKVEYVMNGENKVNPIVGTNTYMLPALKGDTNLTAHLEYTGHWAKDETTGVWTIEDKNIRIYRDTDHIVVDGVTPENTICVYNVAGMLINTTRVSDGNDRVLISVPLGPTYIVTVDGFAAKIMMKNN